MKTKKHKWYLLDSNYNILPIDFEKCKYEVFIDLINNNLYDVKRCKNKTEFIKYLRDDLDFEEVIK